MDTVYLTLAAARRKNRARAKWHAGRSIAHDLMVAACTSIGVNTEATASPADVPAKQRCRANGCYQQWAAYERSVGEETP